MKFWNIPEYLKMKASNFRDSFWTYAHFIPISSNDLFENEIWFFWKRFCSKYGTESSNYTWLPFVLLSEWITHHESYQKKDLNRSISDNTFNRLLESILSCAAPSSQNTFLRRIQLYVDSPHSCNQFLFYFIFNSQTLLNTALRSFQVGV